MQSTMQSSLTRKSRTLLLAAALALLAAHTAVAATRQTPSPQDQKQPAAQSAPPALEEWRDDFDGAQLDETKWEPYTFEGGGTGKIEVKDKQLRMRGAGGSRSGVRSKRSFAGDRFFFEGTVTKVGERAPQAEEQGRQVGTAVLTVLFDGNTANRIEWLLRSDGIFEAWVSVDGRMERVDGGKLATKEKSPRLGIARRGEQVFFMLNGEVGLERTVRGLPSNFKVMLYGFSNSENNWDSASVRTLKQ